MSDFRSLVESQARKPKRVRARRLVEGDRARARPEKRKHLCQFVREGNEFRPSGPIEIHETLPPGSYTALCDGRGPKLVPYEPITDELIYFEDSKMDRVIQEVDRFWKLKPNFVKLGYLHNRGLLLHGPPGTGKSCLIHQVTEAMVGRGDLVFSASNVYDLKSVLESFRQVDAGRPVIVVLEDMDEYIGHQERNMLQLLDGASATDNVLFLGTTNYINRFPHRLLRPGRFDNHVHIDYPPVNGRQAYLHKKLEGIEKPDVINQLAEKTDGFSFGHLRELVIAGYAFQEDLDKTIQRLRSIGSHDLPMRESGWEDHLNARRSRLYG